MGIQEKIFSILELSSVAAELNDYLKKHKVIAFSGELGSGKTTLISSLCSMLGVKDAVGSPTFSLINEYAYLEGGNSKRIFHIDAYRLKSAEEARQAGIEECFDVDGYCFVEWPEKLGDMLPESALYVKLSHVDSSKRSISVVE